MSKATMLAATLLSLSAGWRHASAAEFAARVVEYLPGDTAAAGFDQPATALGAPERFTGEGVFPSVVSPFSPPFLTSEIVSIGEGGHLTLALSHYALEQSTGAELGIFGNAGLIATGFPDVRAADVLSATEGTFGVDAAVVEVSEDGSDWHSLGELLAAIPTNGYRDITDPFSSTPGDSPSDFGVPFTGMLDDFAGLSSSDPAGPDILDVLGESGGGNWVDFSATGLTRVGYVRLSVADDGAATTALRFELDAVSVASAAVGPPVPEPAAGVLAATSGALCVAAGALKRRKRTPLDSRRGGASH